MTVVLALSLSVCGSFAASWSASQARWDMPSRRSVLMNAQDPPWSVPGPPPDFKGAQWAPWEFGTTLKPPPPIELRQTAVTPGNYAAQSSDAIGLENNIVQAPVEVPVTVGGAAVAVAMGPATSTPTAAPSAPASTPGFFKVTLKMPDSEVTFDCPPNTYMLDHVDEIVDENEALADLPYACRAGSCSACAAKVLSGEVDNSDGGFLSAEQKADGFILTCTTYIKSDAVIQTHTEEDLF